jgi:PIN domain nuclease of toxin-antitoxin system
VNLLLDTHALLWWLSDDARLPDGARALIGSNDNVVFVSVVSALEIATKFRLGRLPEVAAWIDEYEQEIERAEFTPLAIQTTHALAAGRFSAAHRDPFDRLLAAQAKLEALVLVTRDPVFADFPIAVRW